MENFYKSQTLSSRKLRNSSFIDPCPEETIYTALPSLVVYYLTRWGHLNLITTFNEEFLGEFELQDDFINHPRDLMASVQSDSVSPFPDMIGLKNSTES